MTMPQDEPLAAGLERLSARALFLGERLDPRLGHRRLALSPPVFELGPSAYVALFRYGAAVLFNASADQERELRRELTQRISEVYAHPECEEVEIVIDREQREEVVDGRIVLHALTLERLQIVGEILSKSVALAQGEKSVSAVFDRIEPLAINLGRRGRAWRRAKDLLRHIGNALLTQHKMVVRVEILDKPELLWDRPDLERLYVRLEAEYELRERHVALERKLELISNTAETLLELLQTRRALRVEWYIVLLIVVEILLTLYAMFIRPVH